jgi:hypothetical protein
LMMLANSTQRKNSTKRARKHSPSETIYAAK